MKCAACGYDDFYEDINLCLHCKHRSFEINKFHCDRPQGWVYHNNDCKDYIPLIEKYGKFKPIEMVSKVTYKTIHCSGVSECIHILYICPKCGTVRFEVKENV